MKKIFLVTIALVLSGSLAMAGEQRQESKSGPGLSAWLTTLQKKISELLPKKTIPMTNSVAGVRGAKEDASVKLYWKGKKGDEAVTEEEMAGFKACVDLAEKGDRDGSLKQLEEFMKLYPDSALIPDAKKTLDLVKAEPNSGPQPQEAVEASKPEPATGVKPEEKKEEKKEEQKKEEQK